MREARRRLGFVLLPALAFGLWFWAFAVPAGNFWIKISISAAVLATLSRLLDRGTAPSLELNLRTVTLGLSAAAALYVVFMIGRLAAIYLFGFAGVQIGGIYAKGSGTPLWGIALLLFFVTGPSEEIFWRGYLQRGLQKRFGGTKGYLLATALYAGVHIPSLNVMLVGAATVAGAFWGALYWGSRNLTAATLSHSIWSAVIFTILPLN